jgi:hypothetical protein
MVLDNYRFIKMEQCLWPGSTGDSCAETGRYITLSYLIGEDPEINLFPFMTDKGFLRHPETLWREDDFTSDQMAPFLSAASLTQPLLAGIAVNRIKNAGWKTGNGDYITPGLLASIKRVQNSKIQWIYDLAFLGQALIFKLPIRWSDSKRWFERSEGSSADYLNFLNGIAFAKAKKKLTWPMKLALKLTGKAKIMSKVEDYYFVEPNSQWILDIYKKALEVL